jgi:phage I-like protein
MAAYTAHGVDLMIDLEHGSLDELALRADSKDARGWMRLELSADGSLWAADVRWTDDGAERLRSKKQRYTSPAFKHTDEGQILEIVNAAICSMPATYNNAPLVAATRVLARPARRATVLSTMDPKDVQAAIDALKNNDPAAALALLEKILVSAAGGTPASDSAPPAGSEGGDPMAAQAAQAALAKSLVAALSASINARSGVETLSADICRVFGKATLAEALAAMQADRTEIVTLAADRAALELSKRRELIASLIELGAETPATAWDPKDDADRKARNPVARLSAEPIADMTARVATLRAAAPNAPRAPQRIETETSVRTLSVAERAYCTKHGLTEEQFRAKLANAVVRLA